MAYIIHRIRTPEFGYEVCLVKNQNYVFFLRMSLGSERKSKLQ